MVKYDFERKFHDLKYFEVDFFFHIPYIRYILEVIITKKSKSHQFIVIV